MKSAFRRLCEATRTLREIPFSEDVVLFLAISVLLPVIYHNLHHGHCGFDVFGFYSEKQEGTVEE